MEIWKDISGFEGVYKVSNKGNIKSLSRIDARGRLLKNKLLKLGKSKGGYYQVVLCNGFKKKYKVHRLVAMAFIPNPNNLPQINHKNEVKTDNRVENLEWCTPQYNVNYGNGIAKMREARKRPVYQINKEEIIVGIYATAYEASQKTGIDNSSICKCVKGLRESAGGFKWQNR